MLMHWLAGVIRVCGALLFMATSEALLVGGWLFGLLQTI